MGGGGEFDLAVVDDDAGGVVGVAYGGEDLAVVFLNAEAEFALDAIAAGAIVVVEVEAGGGVSGDL